MRINEMKRKKAGMGEDQLYYGIPYYEKLREADEKKR